MKRSTLDNFSKIEAEYIKTSRAFLKGLKNTGEENLRLTSQDFHIQNSYKIHKSGGTGLHIYH